jgi:ketosteroid isomerase-like protein
MSQENVEVTRRAYEAFNRGDRNAMVADIAPSFEYVAVGILPDAERIHHGPQGWLDFTRWLSDQFDDARIEIEELRPAGDRVVASIILRGRGKQSGAETSWHVWHVWSFRDAKVVHGRGFASREEALEAAGLSE